MMWIRIRTNPNYKINNLDLDPNTGGKNLTNIWN